ncbi:MAG TPA: DMT family transporter [Beijerinckiaceae bacterium]|nr:DMT family transporter [Beijerinckiaceae bacterium]
MSSSSFPPVTPSEARRQRLLAIAMTCGAVLCFTLIDTAAKALSPQVGVMTTTWLRYVAAFLFILPFLNPWRVPDLLKSEKPFLQSLRGLLLFGSTILNFVAMQYLQLAQTVSIGFLAPLLFALLAGPFLGEWAGPRRLIAIVIGFMGVLIVARPGLGVIHPAALLSICSATCYSMVLLLTRNLSVRDSAETTMFYSTFVGVVLMAPLAFLNWKTPEFPSGWALVALTGLGGALGHWLMIQAQRRAAAPVLAPFIYFQIVWMSLSGYVFYGEQPDRWTFLGGAIVVASGLYLLHRERKRKPAAGAAS